MFVYFNTYMAYRPLFGSLVIINDRLCCSGAKQNKIIIDLVLGSCTFKMHFSVNSFRRQE